MKIVLVNPPRERTVFSEVPTTVNAEVNSMPPLGLLYLEAWLHRHAAHDVRIVDCQAEKIGHEALEAVLRDAAADVVGVTGHTHDLMDMLEVSRTARRVCSTSKVWWGGPHVTSFPEESMHFAEVDGAIPGEGEMPFAQVLEALEKGTDLDTVAGILYRTGNGEVVRTPAAPVVTDLDSLPSPRREVLDVRNYYYVLGNEVTATAISSSRGCPYNCTFCNTPGRQTFRGRSPKSVVDEMEACARLGIKEIYFVDDTFNADRQRVQGICEEIVRRGLRIRWNFRARINLLTDDLLALVEKAGCTRIHVGVEAATDEGLAMLRKNLTVEKVREGFERLRKTRMTTVGYFLIGCPHERTREDVMKTVDFAIALDPDYVLFGIITPYPHTDLYDEGVRRGLIDPEHWRRFVLDPKPGFRPQAWTEHLSEEDLAEMLELAFKRFYLRPKVMFRKLLEVRGLKDLWRKMRAGMAIARL